MSDVFKIDITGIEEVSNNLKAFPRRLKAALALDAQNIANDMEAWAKENKPWENRTGDAVKFLKAHVKWTNTNTLMVSLSHHVEYGVYLELANECKYAILEEAVRKYTPQFMDSWKKIISESVGK